RLQTVAAGEAEATRQVFQAIHDGDPTSDVLAVRYLEALTQIADGRATKIVVPTEFSGVLGAVTGIAEAMRPIDEPEAESEPELVNEPKDMDSE
ncbi:MAG: SPFH/Band 7/PHB domain protein, partial [Actinomycetota bacterium]|nr:SPFH/Band 7/PHB domain protein [Actinomycetota bacterium]